MDLIYDINPFFGGTRNQERGQKRNHIGCSIDNEYLTIVSPRSVRDSLRMLKKDIIVYIQNWKTSIDETENNGQSCLEHKDDIIGRLKLKIKYLQFETLKFVQQIDLNPLT